MRELTAHQADDLYELINERAGTLARAHQQAIPG